MQEFVIYTIIQILIPIKVKTSHLKFQNTLNIFEPMSLIYNRDRRHNYYAEKGKSNIVGHVPYCTPNSSTLQNERVCRYYARHFHFNVHCPNTLIAFRLVIGCSRYVRLKLSC